MLSWGLAAAVPGLCLVKRKVTGVWLDTFVLRKKPHKLNHLELRFETPSTYLTLVFGAQNLLLLEARAVGWYPVAEGSGRFGMSRFEMRSEVFQVDGFSVKGCKKKVPKNFQVFK